MAPTELRTLIAHSDPRVAERDIIPVAVLSWVG